MDMISLAQDQLSIAHAPVSSKIFLHGPASCGKTTTSVERLNYLLKVGISGNSILLLTPQRSLQEPYLDLLLKTEREAGGEVTPATIGGLARRMVDLFWPLVSETAGFIHPDQPPVFLTLETAQYYLARIVRPLIQDQGFFSTVTIDRNRLYSQILDNLNKSASVGFPYTEIGARLMSAWDGDPAQRRVYADAQECASRFRRFCLDHNLLDFSLQLEIFSTILWPEDIVRQFLLETFQHLIYDNIEEDIPRAHDLIQEWLPFFDSAFLVFDQDSGYRHFLGADVESGWALQVMCDQITSLERSYVMTPSISWMGNRLTSAIISKNRSEKSSYGDDLVDDPGEGLRILQTHFYPELLDKVITEAANLVETGIQPSEIVILSPYLSDSLRFSITNRLQSKGLPWRTYRPSRSLRDEPACQALLTLAAIAHPHWNIHPAQFDMTYALVQSIDRMDLVRAQLLVDILYRLRDLSLAPFSEIKANVQERITYIFGRQYSILRDWILTYRQIEPLPLDHFLRRLFGEVLSQPGFGFHTNLDSVRVAASLIESVHNFRQAMVNPEDLEIGSEYITLLGEGVIAAQYLESRQFTGKEAILIAPAHTFLMMNQPVFYQFWLDAGSSGWYERLSQPLTQPYVLSRLWERGKPGRVWTDADEVFTSQEAMLRLITGLLRRCRKRLYLSFSMLSESGFEQRGNLLRAFQQILKGNR